MRQQAGQFSDRASLHSFTEESLRLQHERAFDDGWIVSAVNPALAGFVPASHPIAPVNPAIESEIDIGGQDFPDEIFAVDELEVRTERPHGKRVNAAAFAAVKIGQEKMFLVTFGQPCAWIIADA